MTSQSFPVSRFCTPQEVKFHVFRYVKTRGRKIAIESFFLIFLSVHCGDFIEQIKTKSVIYTFTCVGMFPRRLSPQKISAPLLVLLLTCVNIQIELLNRNSFSFCGRYHEMLYTTQTLVRSLGKLSVANCLHCGTECRRQVCCSERKVKWYRVKHVYSTARESYVRNVYSYI